MGDGYLMAPEEYVEELERRFRSADPQRAYMLWLDQRESQVESQLSSDDRRRLRSTLHLLLQMAAGLGWDASTPETTARQRRSV